MQGPVKAARFACPSSLSSHHYLNLSLVMIVLYMYKVIPALLKIGRV